MSFISDTWTKQKEQILILAPVFLAFILIPVSRLVELPVLIMASVAFFTFLRVRTTVLQCEYIKQLTLTFGLFFLAAFISVLDSVKFEKSLVTSVSSLRFYLLGVFLIWFLSKETLHSKVACFISVVLIFWSIDAWVQFLFGTDLFGYEFLVDTPRISGVFGESAKLGNTMVPLLGVAVLPFIRNKAQLILVGALLCSTVFISLNRAAWLSLFYMVLAGIVLALYYKISSVKTVLVYLASSLLLLTMFFFFSPVMQQRLNVTTDFSVGDFDSIDNATSGRLTLWNTSLDMIEDHYVNGVGVRAYRYAYGEYAESDDQFVNVQGVYHPHQIVLEFLTETGVIGLLCYFGILGLLIKTLWRAIQVKAIHSIAYGVPLVLVLAPFNTHLATFSSYWSGIIWLCLGLYFSALKMENVILIERDSKR